MAIYFILILLDRSVYFLKYHRFIILPYSLSLYNRVADEQKESKIFLDKFKRFDKRNQTIYFKNRFFSPFLLFLILYKIFLDKTKSRKRGEIYDL